MIEPFTDEEKARLTAKSDLRGAWLVFCQYALTAGIFIAVALWPNPLSVLVGVVLLGGRQLGFFVLTHEAGHRTLFRTPSLNRFSARWLTGPMDFSNPDAYMREHLAHHRAVGQPGDPDLSNYADYPIARSRLKRKLKRDLSGRTGWRNLSTRLAQFAAFSERTPEDRAALLRGASFNLALLGVVTALGAPWVYLLWLAALVFAYPVIVRIRQIAEHAAVPDLASSDPRLNTRTTTTNPLARLVICPHRVNYHVEHHLLASIPIYRLKAAHELLRSRDFFADAPPTSGYGQVLRASTNAYATP